MNRIGQRKKHYLLFVLTLIFNHNTKPIISQDVIIITNPHNNHRYLLTPEISWSEAQNFAQNMGGNLVTINSQQENQWLVKTFVTEETKFFWIGINDQKREKHFCWISGEESNYSKWAKGEPNDNPKQGGEDFGVLNGQANPFNRPVGTWSDAPSHARLRGVVEIP